MPLCSSREVAQLHFRFGVTRHSEIGHVGDIREVGAAVQECMSWRRALPWTAHHQRILWLGLHGSSRSNAEDASEVRAMPL